MICSAEDVFSTREMEQILATVFHASLVLETTGIFVTPAVDRALKVLAEREMHRRRLDWDRAWPAAFGAMVNVVSVAPDSGGTADAGEAPRRKKLERT